MKRYWICLCVFVCAVALSAGAEVMPPKPQNYFNDYAHLVSPGLAENLDRELAQCERDTSNQLLVAIFPTLQTDSSLEDYTHRITESWGVGQKGKDNGAVFFVFVQQHQLRIEVNYGLEAVLPDALCKRIIEDEVAPRLRANDWDGAMRGAVTAMIAATKGEYQGTGRTLHEQRYGDRRSGGGSGFPVGLIPFVLIILWAVLRTRRHVVYGRGGRGGFWGGGGPWIFPPGGGWGGGGGGWGGGGGGGGGSWGGGGFSGGGGSGGGGGASGSW